MSSKQHKYSAQEHTLEVLELVVDRKTLTFALKENHRGRFIRITEFTGGTRSSVIIPASAYAAFLEKLSALRVDG
jgi:hypothetical protein